MVWSMEKISVQRRAEIEELQQELMNYTTKATRLECEVMALSMKLDDKKLKPRCRWRSSRIESLLSRENLISIERSVDPGGSWTIRS